MSKAASLLCLPLVLHAAICLAQGNKQEDDADLLRAALKEGRVEDALHRIESRPLSASTVPALHSLFQEAKSKEDRQLVAATLLRLGDRSVEYFHFLAAYATTAIEDRTPLWVKYDARGQAVREAFSTEFENWCALNHCSRAEAVLLQFRVYPRDVLFLAEVEDPRAIPLLRRGLQSPNPAVVAYSAQGLGRLHVEDAVPEVAAALERLPGDQLAVVAQLPWFTSIEASRLLARLAPSAAARAYHIRMVEMRRSIERERARKRAASGMTVPQ